MTGLKMKTRILGFTTALLLSTGFVSVADDENLETMKAQFEELRQDLIGEVSAFDERYAGELEKMTENAKAAANLELVLAIRQEQENYKSRADSAEYSKLADLAKVQRIYREHRKQLELKQQDAMLALAAGYRNRLAQLRDKLTKAGEIDEATAAQAELKRVETEFAKAMPSAPATPAGLKEILTSRVWTRHTRKGKHKFTFHSTGRITAEGVDTRWTKYSIRGDIFIIHEEGGRDIPFGLLSESPLTYNGQSNDNRHVKFVEIK